VTVPSTAWVTRTTAALGRRLTLLRQAERGSAVVEFVFLAVLMIIPIFYLVMVMARLQAGAYAVSGAAREAGRAYVTAGSAEDAPARARAAADIAFADQGFAEEGTIALTCDAQPCLRPGARVRVTAAVSVPLPFVPAFFSSVVPTAVPVTATHVASVDRFGGAR